MATLFHLYFSQRKDPRVLPLKHTKRLLKLDLSVTERQRGGRSLNDSMGYERSPSGVNLGTPDGLL